MVNTGKEMEFYTFFFKILTKIDFKKLKLPSTKILFIWHKLTLKNSVNSIKKALFTTQNNLTSLLQWCLSKNISEIGK